ncbi:RNA polymerase sigma factor [Capsulimonas corticalis]|uniref:RNA polymerase sigma factor n=1 Tax=Capsulimonas corticalis TaxID=2219043 RepID=UPI0014025BA3|nr:RNA polymerase sigma factor [Capsulimonas corticalis]
MWRPTGRRPQGGEEENLIAAAQRGDRRAFDTLVRNYRPLLRGLLTRRVTSAEAVDDILQETWMAAWTKLPDYTHRARFKAWLFGIAVHKIGDHHRSRMKSMAEQITPEIERTMTTQDDPYAAVDMKEALNSVLCQLPDAQREVIELYYYAGLTLPEIAETLERNQNTVKYQFYRAHGVVAAGLGMANAL